MLRRAIYQPAVKAALTEAASTITTVAGVYLIPFSQERNGKGEKNTKGFLTHFGYLSLHCLMGAGK